MTTKKNGSKGEKSGEKTVEDDRTRQEEILDFLGKYERNFVDAPVKELRHIISLFLMEVYSSIYGQYSRKVRGLWAKKPDDWPMDVPFVDPNNKMKGEGQNTKCKPKKDACVLMLKHLYIKYQIKRGIKVSQVVRIKPDPLLSTGVSQIWRSDQSGYDDDSLQLQSYSSLYSEPSSVTTAASELDGAVNSIDESINVHGISDPEYDTKWGIVDAGESPGKIFSLLTENSDATSECASGTVCVTDGLQYINMSSADYERHFVDLSRFDNSNPLVDAGEVRNMARQGGIVFNDNNCIAMNQGGIKGPQQVVESESMPREQTPAIKKIEDAGSSGQSEKEECMVGVEQVNERAEAQNFVNKSGVASQVEDCDDLFKWDPLGDSTKRIVGKLGHIKRLNFLEDPLYGLLNEAYCLFCREVAEMSAVVEQQERLVHRAHILEGAVDIVLHLKSLPSELEIKLKNFLITTNGDEVVQTKTFSTDCQNETPKGESQEDIKCSELESVSDPSSLNIKCRKTADVSKPLPFSAIEIRQVPHSSDNGYLVESGMVCKDHNGYSTSDCGDKEFMFSEDSLVFPDFLLQNTGNGCESWSSFGHFLIEKEETAGVAEEVMMEKVSCVPEVSHSSSQESVGSSGLVQQCTSREDSVPSEDVQNYSETPQLWAVDAAPTLYPDSSRFNRYYQLGVEPYQSSNGVQRSQSNNGVQPSQFKNGVQLSQSNNRVQLSQFKDGVQLFQSNNGVQPSHSSNGVQASQSSYGVQASQSSYGVQPSQSSYGVQPSQSSYSVQPSQSHNGSAEVRNEQCTERWASSITMASPGPDIVKSFAEVSLHSADASYFNAEAMWQSEGRRPVVNDSAGMVRTRKVSACAQRPMVMSESSNRSIMRDILKESTSGGAMFTTKRKFPEEDEDVCVKPQVAGKPLSLIVPAPIPTFVTNANLDDPHFSSHYRKKVKTVYK